MTETVKEIDRLTQSTVENVTAATEEHLVIIEEISVVTQDLVGMAEILKRLLIHLNCKDVLSTLLVSF